MPRFCEHCSAKVISDESPPDKSTSPKSESTSPSPKVICIGLGVAVTAILIFGLLIYRNSSDRDVSNKPASVEQANT